MEKSEREAMLWGQLKVIQGELAESEDNLGDILYRERIKNAKMPEYEKTKSLG